MTNLVFSTNPHDISLRAVDELGAKLGDTINQGIVWLVSDFIPTKFGKAEFSEKISMCLWNIQKWFWK